MVVKRVSLFIGIVLVGLSSACADNAKDQKDKSAEKAQVEKTGEQANGSKLSQKPSISSPSNTASKTVNVPNDQRIIQFEPPRVVEYDDEYPPTVKRIEEPDWSARTQKGTEDYYGDGDAAPEPRYITEDVVYEIVDEPAEYPGGMDAMREYLKKNLMYPAIAKENGIQGKCYLRFVVNTDGSISDVRLLRGVTDCPECDKEATRVVKNMPKWKPGRMNGKDVKMYFTLPIAFKLT
jgi:periplasmic protein TonB